MASNNGNSSRADLLEALRKRLETINADRIAHNHRYSISLADITSPEKVAKAKNILDTYGVLFITDAIPVSEVDIIKDALVETHNEMFGKDMHGIIAKSVEQIPALAKGGILGNKGFAYLYKQPLLKEVTPTVRIGGYPIYMDHNPVYRDINLETLLQNPHMLATILALTHYKHVMVSQDSAKIATNPKSNINPFTVPHLDAYSSQTERCQIILTVAENRTKLFYAPGTTDSIVKDLLMALQGDNNLYSTDGFKAINNVIAEVIRPYMVAAPPLSLSLWKSGIIHAEWTSAESLNAEQLYQPDPVRAYNQYTNQLTIRLVMGTHIPIELADMEKMQLAIMAEEGFITHRYLQDRFHHGVTINKMHKGKTQYKVGRKQPQLEKDLAKSVISKVEDHSYVRDKFSKLSPMLRHIYGIPMDEKDYPPELKRLIQNKNSPVAVVNTCASVSSNNSNSNTIPAKSLPKKLILLKKKS